MLREITILVSVVLLGISIYSLGKTNGYHNGYQIAVSECIKKQEEISTALDTMANTINTNLKNSGTELDSRLNSMSKDTQAIIRGLKNQPQPLVLVNPTTNECEVSEQLLDARRKAIERVNK